jgi:transposase
VSATKNHPRNESSDKFKLYGGVDLHDDNFTVNIIDRYGNRCDSKHVPTTQEDIRKYFTPYKDQSLYVAVETGNPTFWFCDVLEDMGIKTFIVNTLKYSRTSNSKQKYDKRDAKNLALDLLKDNLPDTPVFRPDPIQRRLRTKISHRNQYVKDRVRISNRANSFLMNKGIKVKKRSLRDSIKYWKSIPVLIQEIYKDKDQGESLSILDDFTFFLEDFKKVTENIKTIEIQMHQLIKANYLTVYNRLITVPGIGFTIACALIALVGDFGRFKTSKRFVAYLGLAPSTRTSNDRKLKGHGLITKEGSPLMRSYLIQGGLCIIRGMKKNDTPLGRWYENIRIRKGWKKARVALVRKVCEIIFAMIRKEKDFDPSLLTKNSKPEA